MLSEYLGRDNHLRKIRHPNRAIVHKRGYIIDFGLGFLEISGVVQTSLMLAIMMNHPTAYLLLAREAV